MTDILTRLRDPKAVRPRPEEIALEIERLRADARMKIWIVLFTAFMSVMAGSALTLLAMRSDGNNGGRLQCDTQTNNRTTTVR